MVYSIILRCRNGFRWKSYMRCFSNSCVVFITHPHPRAHTQAHHFHVIQYSVYICIFSTTSIAYQQQHVILFVVFIEVYVIRRAIKILYECCDFSYIFSHSGNSNRFSFSHNFFWQYKFPFQFQDETVYSMSHMKSGGKKLIWTHSIVGIQWRSNSTIFAVHQSMKW